MDDDQRYERFFRRSRPLLIVRPSDLVEGRCVGLPVAGLPLAVLRLTSLRLTGFLIAGLRFPSCPDDADRPVAGASRIDSRWTSAEPRLRLPRVLPVR